MMIVNPKRAAGLYEPLADINVTPLVDVMLVLLIVFMITAPMLAAGMRVDLPRATAAQPLGSKDPMIVTIAKDGTIYVGADEISPDQLVTSVRAKVGADLNRAIYVRGDRDVPYGRVVAVMDQLAANGMAKISLIANTSTSDPVHAPGSVAH
jgi:biopolymer transport protein TolR